MDIEDGWHSSRRIHTHIHRATSAVPGSERTQHKGNGVNECWVWWTQLLLMRVQTVENQNIWLFIAFNMMSTKSNIPPSKPNQK